MATENRPIDASKLLNKYNLDCKTAPERYIALVEAPTVDAVSRGVHEQVRWERDVAIEQLESYGVSLGEKADVVKLPKGKPGDYLEWDNGTGFKQIYHIHSVMFCEDCMRYELEKFTPVVNHKNIVRIMSREEAEKEWHERCARERTQEEPTLTAAEIDFDYEAEDGQ